VAERLDTDVQLASWTRAMRARNLSHKTISGYVESAGQLTAFADERGADPLCRRTIEESLAHLFDTRAPATVSVRYRELQQWTRWLADEDELLTDPMAKMPPPQVPEQPVELVTEDEMRRLLASCKAKDYVARRERSRPDDGQWDRADDPRPIDEQDRPYESLTQHQMRALLDRRARRQFRMSIDEFEAALDRGEFTDEPQATALAILLRGA
jgi:hypothetical protein